MSFIDFTKLTQLIQSILTQVSDSRTSVVQQVVEASSSNASQSPIEFIIGLFVHVVGQEVQL